jgi:hypothetical protein
MLDRFNASFLYPIALSVSGIVKFTFKALERNKISAITRILLKNTNVTLYRSYLWKNNSSMLIMSLSWTTASWVRHGRVRTVSDYVKPISQCRHRRACIWNEEPLGEGEKGMGSKRGGVSIWPTRDLSGRESHHDAKEGFQVSKKGAQERGQGFSSKGGYQKDWVMHSNIMLILYISC